MKRRDIQDLEERNKEIIWIEQEKVKQFLY